MNFLIANYWLIYKGAIEEKERLLRHAYGLGYPEPNVTFALCRGSWSSPAVRKSFLIFCMASCLPTFNYKQIYLKYYHINFEVDLFTFRK